MSIISIVKNIIPNASKYFLEDIGKLTEPRYMYSKDILNWVELRKQINPNTGKINSYRDIQKICKAIDRTIPSLGTLRNYLGSGGISRIGRAKAEWLAWFEDFGRISNYYRKEHEGLTTREDWEDFRTEYNAFFGFV